MPADTTGIDDVDLAAPGIVGRGLQFDHESVWQCPSLDLPPIAVEIIDFEGDHLVGLPLGHIDVLQDEIRFAEAQTGQTRGLPHLLKAKLLKKGDRSGEVRPGRDKWIKCHTFWRHCSSSAEKPS